ncbi:MAG: hypothetical protein DRO04_02645, partial [Candidatus Iainarchaeum archaeon]
YSEKRNWKQKQKKRQREWRLKRRRPCIYLRQRKCGEVVVKKNHHIELFIVGAETGPRRRPCDIQWVRQIRDDCAMLRVRFFLKQVFINSRKTHELDGVDYSRIPPWEVFGGA